MPAVTGRLCSVEGCERKHLAKGLCSTHYNRQAKAAGKDYYPTVHVPCATCGQPVLKRTDSRRQVRFCSYRCRDDARAMQALDEVMTLPRPAARLRQPRPSKPQAPEYCALDWHACGWCGQDFPRQPARGARDAREYCTRKCKLRAGRCRRAGREVGGTWTWSDFMRMARLFEYCCAYCGEKPDRLDPDHVVPLSKGGPNVLANLLPVCLLCNSSKRDLLLEEWAGERRRRGQAPRMTTWSTTDPRYWHLTTSGAYAA